MKLKHVLFSSLFLSAGLVACTNDEFAEIKTPSADVENGISLGEGFTISGMKFAETPDTKAYFEANNGSLNAYWEETDVVGAAWYNMVREIDKETGLVTASSGINKEFAYFSNTDFNFLEFVGNDESRANFRANTNVMAGAYVMYCPWDESVAQVSSAIPVKREFPCTVDLTEGHEFDAVSERMFSYGVAAFVPGGRQTRYFQLKQVPVLYRLRFGAEKMQLVNLENNPLVIDRIIFEAYDDRGSVLTTEGTVIPTQLTSEDYNNYIEWLEEGDATVANPLPAAKYNRSEEGVVGHYTIVLNNSDQPAYRIDALDKPGLTDGAVVFSALPFLRPATKVVVKIITSDGMNLEKVYIDDENLKIFNEAYKEGGFVMNDIYVDTQTEENTIYTRDQFLAQWNDAVENERTATLTIADPVMLEDVALSTPDLNGANITINIKRGDNADLTIGSIDLQGKGSLTINSNVVVKGNVRSWSNNKLTITGELEANDIRVGGKAELRVKKMNSLYVEDSGEMTLTVSDNAERADIGNITVEGDGELTMAGGFITSINGGNKPITLNNEVTNYGNFDGALEGTGIFVNEGTFNGAVASGVKFTNEAGAKATIANTENASNVTLVNEAAADGKDAGVVTIQNSERVSLTLANGSTNNGVINVVSGTMTGAYANKEAGRIYVEADATVGVGSRQTVTNNGWIVLNDVEANLTGFTKNLGQNGYNTALSVKDAADLSSRGDAVWFWIDAPITIAKEVQDAYINANVTLDTNASLTGYTRISENVTFSKAGEGDLTVSVNELSVTGHLTISEGIKLNGKVTSSADFQHITGDISNLTVKGSN